jgi:arylsulfatase A-like enzyme
MAALKRQRVSMPLALVAGSILASTCGPTIETASVTTTDLTSRFAHATVGVETAVIDFGTAEARGHLLSGWSQDYADANDRPLVRSVGERSTLRFFLFEPHQISIRFRCRPRSDRRSISVIEIELNGVTAGRVELESRLKTYDLEVPADLLLAGENLLSFIYTFGEPASEALAGAAVDLTSVGWFRLAIIGVRPAIEPPVADPTRDVLFLPYGSRIELPLVASPGTFFETDRLDFRGGSEPALHIAVVTDEGEMPLATLDPSRMPKTVDLATATPDALFLILRSKSESEWSSGDGVYMRHPRIRATTMLPAPPRDGPPIHPNILLYLVDTLRTDHLAAYGYGRATSPRLDEFAESATLFRKAVAQSSWTRPSIASLFTAQWPGAHAVIKRRDALSSDAETLAELLGGAGYTSAGFSGNPNIAEAFGFAQGFDVFELLPGSYDSARTNDRVFEWLDSRPSDSPFFLYVHTADPHTPYLPREPFRTTFAANAAQVAAQIERNPNKESWSGDPDEIRQLLDLYDAEIAANDASFGALIDQLRERDLFDDTMIVFLSDHGEEFLDHGGWTHGRNLHAETLDVPLLVKLPQQQRARQVTEVVQQLDLLPTILDLVGVPQPTQSEGRSLMPLLTQPIDESLGDRPGYSHVSLVRGLTTSVIVGEWKLISRKHQGRETINLYRWPDDKDEHNDLSSRFPVRTRSLAALLEEKLASPTSVLQGEEAKLDRELEQRLKALGYL